MRWLGINPTPSPHACALLRLISGGSSAQQEVRVHHVGDGGQEGGHRVSAKVGGEGLVQVRGKAQKLAVGPYVCRTLAQVPRIGNPLPAWAHACIRYNVFDTCDAR